MNHCLLQQAFALTLLAASIAAHAGTGSNDRDPGDDPAGQWWDRITALCGQAFAGEVDYEPEGDAAMAGQRLVMHVRDCTAERIRIPFVVGDNLSRTWVLTRHGDRIQLKHDHRDADGAPEPVTQYGGVTSNSGSAGAQMFPADEETRRAIPGSGQRSVWMMEISSAKNQSSAKSGQQQFVYAANRVGTPRGFRIVFDLTTLVAAPAAPWGWED